MNKEELYAQAEKAKEAAFGLGMLSSEVKNQILENMARALERRQQDILEANEKDMEQGRNNGLSQALLDRLLLTSERISDMAEGLRTLKALQDPVGEILSMWTRPNGLQVGKVRVPLGVVGIIYEARPNVTVDAAGLCLKTGNAVILRGGSEAFKSNRAISSIIAEAAVDAGAPKGSIQLVGSTDRAAVDLMLKMNKYLDVVIPRGGAGLIRHVVENSTVPVIETGVGNCHVFVDRGADLNKAVAIVVNSKTQRPGVCNAMETLLVDREIADEFLPLAAEKLQAKNVELRGDADSRSIVAWMKEAQEEDWYAEYLDLILAVKVVDDVDSAINHINHYGTKHTEAIVTENYSRSRKFIQMVDAAAVNVNASTRFTDGFQYGYGAEIGISTQKLHARGPMGPAELTTIKYIVMGDGQIRS